VFAGLDGRSFSIELGARVRRTARLPGVADEDFAWNEGEAALVVWCPWRLFAEDGALLASDTSPEHAERRLRALVGDSVSTASCAGPPWTLTLVFASGARLVVLGDESPSDIERSWEVWAGREALLAGPADRWVLYTAPAGDLTARP
jgi:hypothetical protein